MRESRERATKVRRNPRVFQILHRRDEAQDLRRAHMRELYMSQCIADRTREKDVDDRGGLELHVIVTKYESLQREVLAHGLQPGSFEEKSKLQSRDCRPRAEERSVEGRRGELSLVWVRRIVKSPREVQIL